MFAAAEPANASKVEAAPDPTAAAEAAGPAVPARGGGGAVSHRSRERHGEGAPEQYYGKPPPTGAPPPPGLGRVFVTFTDPAGAAAAAAALHGRRFGGRTVVASYGDEGEVGAGRYQ
jgi:hypothetical protein